MGLGFNLLVIFFVIPFTVVGGIIWIFTKSKILAGAIAVCWAGIFFIVLLVTILKPLTSKVVLTKEDYYGSYIVNRDYFPGKQADWQYNHFRFEIKNNDSISFHLTDGEKIKKTYRGTVAFTAPYVSKIIILKMPAPTHHILMDNPTTYRETWSFYLVFDSPKFGNVFFTKGDWEPLR